MEGTKYCKFCGEQIDADCVVCPKCGKQIEMLQQAAPPAYQQPYQQPGYPQQVQQPYPPQQPYQPPYQAPPRYQQQPQVVINNNVSYGKHEKNKWVALFLCIFLGFAGIHKFYEGKILFGLVYMCTGGLFLVGWIADIFILAMKPNPYLV